MRFHLTMLVVAASLHAGCAGGPAQPNGSKLANIFQETGKYHDGNSRVCPKDQPHRVITDVDGTAVKSNFVAGPIFLEEARAALAALHERFGLIYLSANFKYTEMKAYFKEHKYPDGPLYTRPWRMIEDYGNFCLGGYPYDACEYIFKVERIRYWRSKCNDPKPWLGVGDKFSDYAAYLDGGICPMIVTSGKIHQANKEALSVPGCEFDPKLGYYYNHSDTNRMGERCPAVPKNFIVDWPQAAAKAAKYLNGEVACGEW